MKIDFQRITDQTGREFDNAADVLDYLKRQICFLATHNKNLTNKQYYAICDIESILNSITAE